MVNLEEINDALQTLGNAFEKYTERQVKSFKITDDKELEELMWRLTNIFVRK